MSPPRSCRQNSIYSQNHTLLAQISLLSPALTLIRQWPSTSTRFLPSSAPTPTPTPTPTTSPPPRAVAALFGLHRRRGWNPRLRRLTGTCAPCSFPSVVRDFSFRDPCLVCRCEATPAPEGTGGAAQQVRFF